MEANNVPAITITVSSHLCVFWHHFSCLVLLFQGYIACQNFNLTGFHPSSETQGQSVWLGGTTKVFKHRRKSPLVPILTGPLPNIQVNAGSWLGPQNALYYCAQSANSISWVFFVSLYTMAIVSPYLSGVFTNVVRATDWLPLCLRGWVSSLAWLIISLHFQIMAKHWTPLECLSDMINQETANKGILTGVPV